MKNNAKRIAALIMVLTLLFCVSATAFASTVYSNIITIQATEEPEAVEPEATEEPEVTEPEVTEEPEITEPEATEEPEITEPEVTEEPEITEPEVTEEPEITEPEVTEEPEITEPEVTEEPEATEEPGMMEMEPIEPEATEEPEVTEEPEAVEPEPTPVPGPTAEELLEGVEVSVHCQIVSEGAVPSFGDKVVLTAIVTGADEIDYNIVWEFRADAQSPWTVSPLDVTEVISFPLTRENCMSEWRARLVLVMPEPEVAEEPVQEEVEEVLPTLNEI